MCGAGVEQYYIDLLEQESIEDIQESNEDIIQQTLVNNSSFASISFSTFSIRVPSP